MVGRKGDGAFSGDDPPTFLLPHRGGGVPNQGPRMGNRGAGDHGQDARATRMTGSDGEAEIDLLFETIDAGDGDLDAVAGAEDAPGPIAGQALTDGVELVEIIVEG